MYQNLCNIEAICNKTLFFSLESPRKEAEELSHHPRILPHIIPESSNADVGDGDFVPARGVGAGDIHSQGGPPSSSFGVSSSG
jgi:hypothetical protein